MPERETASGSLTLVGTPIGNLSDFSPRGVETLLSCDAVAAEDTRVTLKLLNHFGIKKPLISYHEHNKRERGEMLCRRMLEGESIALVTDAGMPGISDPGEDLVALCHEKQIPVLTVPGPTALTTALPLSGIPASRFVFEGFLPTGKRERRERLAFLTAETRTLVFYEAPHKLAATLSDLYKALGERRVTLSRELTKLYEEVIPTTLSVAAGRYADTSPRGEFVLVVEGAAPSPEPTACSPEQAEAVARRYLEEGMSPSEVARRTAAETGFKRNDIYKMLI